MSVVQGVLRFETAGKGLTDITSEVGGWLAQSRLLKGVLTLFCRHTSAGLLISENASAAVQRDLLRWLDRVVPEGRGYEHDDEGPDDMPAHIKENGMLLGIWQGVFLIEHRARSHRREIVVTGIGE